MRAWLNYVVTGSEGVVLDVVDHDRVQMLLALAIHPSRDDYLNRLARFESDESTGMVVPRSRRLPLAVPSGDL